MTLTPAACPCCDAWHDLAVLLLVGSTEEPPDFLDPGVVRAALHRRLERLENEVITLYVGLARRQSVKLR